MPRPGGLDLLSGAGSAAGDSFTGWASGLVEGEKLRRQLANQDVEAQLRALQILREQIGLTSPKVSISGSRALIQQPNGQWAIQDLPAPPPTPLQEAQTDAARARAERDRATATGGTKLIDQIERQVEEKGLDSLTPGQRAVWNAHHKPDKPTAPNIHYQTDDKGNTTQIITRVGPNGEITTEKHPMGAIGKGVMSAGGGLSAAAIEAQAQAVADGGPMPSRRTLGSAFDPIMNRAAEILAQRGDTGGSLAVRQATYQANKKALGTITTQEAQIRPFSKTATDSLTRARDLSAKIDRSGVPVLNRWILAGRKSIKGDPDVAAFDYHLRLGINEVAKITSTANGGGGVVSDASRKEIEETLNRTMTHEQIVAVIEGAQYEMDSRLRHIAEEKAALQKAMSGGVLGVGKDGGDAAKKKPVSQMTSVELVGALNAIAQKPPYNKPYGSLPEETRRKIVEQLKREVGE